MKFIDKEGKVFGLINIFDLFILAILIFSISFALEWARIAKDPSWVEARLFHIHCIATYYVPSYMADLVKEGDEIYNKDGISGGRVKKILENKPSNAGILYTEEGNKVVLKADDRDITLLLDLLAYERNGEIYHCFGDSPLRVGGTITLTTKEYVRNFTITKVLKRGK